MNKDLVSKIIEVLQMRYDFAKAEAQLEIDLIAQGFSSVVYSIGIGGQYSGKVAKLLLGKGRIGALTREIHLRSELRKYGFLKTPQVIFSQSGDSIELFKQEGEECGLIVEELIKSESVLDFPCGLVSRRMLRSAAITLRELHEASNKVASISLPSHTSFVDSLRDFERDNQALAYDSLSDGFLYCYSEVVRSLSQFESLPSIVAHGDYHPGNLAWENDTCLAVFDFEYSRKEIRILELAYAILMFCVDWTDTSFLIRQDYQKDFIDFYGIGLKDSDLVLKDQEIAQIPRALALVSTANIIWARGICLESSLSLEFQEKLKTIIGGSEAILFSLMKRAKER